MGVRLRQITDADDRVCWAVWWNPGDSYMAMHQCGRPLGHEGRHTCEDRGCRSWRADADDEEG